MLMAVWERGVGLYVRLYLRISRKHTVPGLHLRVFFLIFPSRTAVLFLLAELALAGALSRVPFLPGTVFVGTFLRLTIMREAEGFTHSTTFNGPGGTTSPLPDLASSRVCTYIYGVQSGVHSISMYASGCPPALGALFGRTGVIVLPSDVPAAPAPAPPPCPPLPPPPLPPLVEPPTSLSSSSWETSPL